MRSSERASSRCATWPRAQRLRARIAGVCDPSGRVFGLMPHPEAFLVRENHPLRRRASRDEPGIELFENGVRAARDAS